MPTAAQVRAAQQRQVQRLGGRMIPRAGDLRMYDVIRRNSVEGVKQNYYDRLTYNANGQSELKFFQVPLGQGTGIGGGAKGFEDTNMELAGMLPNPKAFLLQGIEINFFPAGLPVVADASTPTVPNMTNDMYAFSKRGWLELFISSKTYLQEAPLAKFPARNFMRSDMAVSADAEAAPALITMELPVMSGKLYQVMPPITLRPTMNFSVSLKWDGGGVPLPSLQNAQVMVSLVGLLYRNGQ